MCHPQTDSLQSYKDDHRPSEGSGVRQRCPQEFKSSKFDISHLMEAKCEAAVDSGIVGVGSTSHADVDSGVALTCERAPCVNDRKGDDPVVLVVHFSNTEPSSIGYAGPVVHSNADVGRLSFQVVLKGVEGSTAHVHVATLKSTAVRVIGGTPGVVAVAKTSAV